MTELIPPGRFKEVADAVASDAQSPRAAQSLQRRHAPLSSTRAQLEMLDALREILTEDGRTLPQAALGWLWALDPNLVPISGFKTVKQVQDNFNAIEYGPLAERQMNELEEILKEFEYNFTVLD